MISEEILSGFSEKFPLEFILGFPKKSSQDLRRNPPIISVGDSREMLTEFQKEFSQEFRRSPRQISVKIREKLIIIPKDFRRDFTRKRLNFLRISEEN